MYTLVHKEELTLSSGINIIIRNEEEEEEGGMVNNRMKRS